jgi:anaerobic ribonucleoside-triphosphate reductase activating protein
MIVTEHNDHGCRRRSDLKLAGFLSRSTVNGPGTRAVIWVQGCPIRCVGCFNPQSWPFSPAQSVSVSGLSDRILALDGIDGVTFSGGEPFAQAGALATLGELVKERGLSVVTFTGFSYREITRKHRPSWQRLLAVTDLLVAGPFIKELRCEDPLLGSSNQELIHLTGALLSSFSPAGGGRAQTEVTISPDGSLTTTGFPEPGFMEKLACRCRGG